MSETAPISEAEARSLRPYIPVETMAQVEKLTLEYNEESKRNSARRDKLSAEYKVAQETARTARQKANALRKQLDAIPWFTDFSKLDAARQTAWEAARKVRDAAIAAGEAPRYETAEQATERRNRRAA